MKIVERLNEEYFEAQEKFAAIGDRYYAGYANAMCVAEQIYEEETRVSEAAMVEGHEIRLIIFIDGSYHQFDDDITAERVSLDNFEGVVARYKKNKSLGFMPMSSIKWIRYEGIAEKENGD